MIVLFIMLNACTHSNAQEHIKNTLKALLHSTADGQKLYEVSFNGAEVLI